MSQEYTPVLWIDETPNQIGTIINKERLDQMQTAHHFADGFEEVDAVPTSDPGVDYHKVVFCTADTTFYRWDGTQWVKDVDDSTLALLEAHEADHSNPHVVTKAQVGLGNCDNTSDADKPVSTAQQTALDAKVDDTQIKSSWSSPVSNDNIPSEKLVKDTLDTKADKATTLAGYGITDAYTKAEIDAAFVDLPSTQAITGVKTVPLEATGTFSSQIASSNKVKNELDNYAPMVRTSGNQIIVNDKTFLGTLRIGNTTNPLSGNIQIVTNGAYRRIRLQNIADDLDTPPNSNVGYPIIAWTDVDDTNACTLLAQHLSDGKTRLVCSLRNSDGTTKNIVLGVSD